MQTEMKKLILSIILFVNCGIGYSQMVSDQKISLTPMFSKLTGNVYKEWTTNQQILFIYGLLEGIVLHETIDIHPYGVDRNPNNTQNFINCVVENFPNSEQIHRIIEKEINNNPQNLDIPISLIVVTKFRRLCRDLEYLEYSDKF
jgi:hypothetical protein